MVANIQKQIEMAKVEFSLEFLKRWNRRTPVDTGTLRKGNTVKTASSQFEFINEVPYFGYVEDGTPTHRPVGMLKTTVLEANEIWNIAMKRAKR
jgi:hypothetical protein